MNTSEKNVVYIVVARHWREIGERVVGVYAAPEKALAERDRRNAIEDERFGNYCYYVYEHEVL